MNNPASTDTTLSPTHRYYGHATIYVNIPPLRKTRQLLKKNRYYGELIRCLDQSVANLSFVA